MATQNRLTFFERQQIESLLRQHWKLRDIAGKLGRDHSVISREVSRNTGQHPDYFPYTAVVAQQATERRARLTNKRKLDKNPKLKDWVGSRLKAGWSPEQVAGRLKTKPPATLTGTYVSDEAIYAYIYTDYSAGEPWWQYLRKAHYTRHANHGRTPRKVTIPEKVSIHQRPELVNERQRLGDFEVDLICFGTGKEAVSVAYERKSQLVRMSKVTNKGSEATKEALIKVVENLPAALVQTMTFDNGGENAKHTDIRDDFGIDTYFCDTYSSWQKGGVENMNGLLRQYLPKKLDPETIDETMLTIIQERLNNRPRKTNGFLTPNECLEEYTDKSILVH